MIANAIEFLNTHPKLLAFLFMYCVGFLVAEWWKAHDRKKKKKDGEFHA